MKYKDWLNVWINNYIKPQLKRQTFKKYESIVRLHIMPFLGEYELIDLSAIELQKFVGDRIEKGLKSSTVNAIITVLKMSLKAAVETEVVEKQYSDKIRRPKLIQKQIECFSIEEQKKIESYIIKTHNLKMYGVVIALYTGLRIGELLSIEWADVDTKRACIRINKTCYDSWCNGRYVKCVDVPKTLTSIRIIPLPRQIIPFLKEIKEKTHSKYVIIGKTNEGAQVRSYQHSFEILLKRLGISHKGFHALRHTFATRAIECGVDVKTLSEIMGHKNVEITLNRYAHCFMEHKHEMINRLGKLLIK